MGNDHQNEHRNGSDTLTEQALRVSELSCRRLFEAAQDGILILDGDPGAVKIVTAVRREAALLKATKPTTTLQRRVPACRQTMPTMLQGIP